MWWGRAEPKPTGWRLPGCAILLQDLLRGGIQLLDSAQCNLLTLEKKKNPDLPNLSRVRWLHLDHHRAVVAREPPVLMC